ncbi:MAG: Asp-tRNA(Asn)/Glu-tRNA(Gln) amidotransferase subunit GatA [Actinobacteria bacterium]|nr:MAG: Asp-tRNA(Asn)/Glu-tRNA(Gln) amidotransferase subunit GatA [Actinomycetota bacterium]
MAELWELDAAALARTVAAGESSASDVVEAHLARIDALDPELHAFLTLTPELARAQAAAVDSDRAAGRALGPLSGVPIALKDVLCTDGVRTTAGSKILESYVPPYDATVVHKLRAAGMPILGKTNQDEFAMGSSTENSAFGVTRNPWDLARVPGGSSGGSAAAVAAGMAPVSLGTDTGGSIRQPAALCGVVGVKPTYGRVSRYGLIAFASSLDQIGPFARSVRDAAAALQAIAGHDPMDSTSAREPVPDYVAALDRGVEGLRVGVVREGMGEGTQPGVKARVAETAERFTAMGCSVDEVSLRSFDVALSAYYLIAPAECSSNLARYDGVRYGYRADDPRDVVDMNMRSRSYGFGDEVKRRIMLGTYALSAGYYDAYYGKAQKVRTLVIRDFDEAYERFDFLICPASPTTAFKIGEKSDDPLAMYLSDLFTIPSNLAGAAGISMPCGLAEDGLPVGVQLLGPPLSEELLFRAGHALEQALGRLPTPPVWESR